MIADQETTKNWMKLEIYTPQYVMALKNNIIAYTNDKYNNDFYAFSVCHLGKSIDISAGILWPKGKQTPINDNGYGKEALIIVNKISLKIIKIYS